MSKLLETTSQRIKTEIQIVHVSDFDTIPDGSYYSIIAHEGLITGLFKRNATEAELAVSPHLNKEPEDFYLVYCAGNQELYEQNAGLLNTSNYQVRDCRPGYIIWNPSTAPLLKTLVDDVVEYNKGQKEVVYNNTLPVLGYIDVRSPHYDRISWMYEPHPALPIKNLSVLVGKIRFHVSTKLGTYVEEYTGVKVVIENVYSIESKGHLVGSMNVEETEHGGLKISVMFEPNVTSVCELRFPEEIADHFITTNQYIAVRHVTAGNHHCVYLDLVG